MKIHDFDQAIVLAGPQESRTNQLSPAYNNMVGPFGGVTAATLLKAVMTHSEAVGDPVALTVNYIGAITASDIIIKPRLIKQNRSNAHWCIDASAEGEAILSATLVLANRRETWNSTEIPCPQAPPLEQLSSIPEEQLMEWAKRYDMRFVKGNLFEEPVDDGGPTSESLAWIADKPYRKLDFLSLTAMCDSFFPRLFIRERTFAPIGTVSLTIHFHASKADLESLPSAWLLAHARAGKYSQGYFDQTGELWSQDGHLLATTSQMVYYKY
ncbi:acyl-CoA thioesterase [Maricurvus nonylphenolicus]|uniref:acyl-CoA thioesterase n=1 Tax=Maricurvus nonylphenolicus TaxID=1008307 RepID=UPI0036F44121